MPREFRQDAQGNPTAQCRTKDGRGCGEWKPLDSFYTSPREPGGISRKCKSCIRQDRKTAYEKLSPPQKRAAYQKQSERREQKAQAPNTQEEARLGSRKFRRDDNGAWVKQCGRKDCQEWKPLTEFYIDQRTAHGCSVWCINCTNAYNMRYQLNLTAEQKENQRQQRKQYHKDQWENNPAYRQRRLDYNREKRNAMSREQRYQERRQRHLRHTFGIDAEAFAKLYDAASGKCQICGKLLAAIHRGEQAEGGEYPCIDHSKTCGCVRGLLCVRCNLGLGQLGHSISRLAEAVGYLERFEGACAIAKGA